MSDKFILQIIIQCIFASAIAYFIGRKRLLGFWWSFFFSVALTPLIGLFIVLDSRKKSNSIIIKPSKLKLLGGVLLIILGIGFVTLFYTENHANNPIMPNLIILCFVWGIFCISRSTGVKNLSNDLLEIEDLSDMLNQEYIKPQKTNLLKRKLLRLKKVNNGVYRMTIVLSVVVSFGVSISIAAADNDWPALVVLPIPVWLLFWLLVFILLWIYDGFAEKNDAI